MGIRELKEILETDIVFFKEENFSDEFLNDVLFIEIEKSVKLFKNGKHSEIREPITKVKDINYDEVVFIRYCNYTKKAFEEELKGTNQDSLIFIKVNKELKWGLLGLDDIKDVVSKFIQIPRYKIFNSESYREYVKLKEVISNIDDGINGESKKRRL